MSDILEFKNIGYFRSFQTCIFSIFFQHYFITWCKNLTKMRKYTFQVFSTAYYLILKHFYCVMLVVQSAVLLLLLFLVALFWNIQLKCKPFNWHHPIQCSKTKISKVSYMYRNIENIQYFWKYRDIFHPCLGDWRDWTH